ncbi:MAG: DNA-processing protein DprA, partial [Enterovibrio sp.]
KYIYCLADSSLVIHSNKKGGTLSGAEENLKKAWVPLWIKTTTDKNAANADLVAKGGQWLSAELQSVTIADLIKNKCSQMSPPREVQTDLFSMTAEPGLSFEPKPAKCVEHAKFDRDNVPIKQQIDKENLSVHIENELASNAINFYQLFITELSRLAKDAISIEELVEGTRLHKSQLHEWLDRAEKDGLVNKLNQPIRYQFENKK